jgi:hypothetical protein
MSGFGDKTRVVVYIDMIAVISKRKVIPVEIKEGRCFVLYSFMVGWWHFVAENSLTLNSWTWTLRYLL